MTGTFKNPETDIESTDELPILTEKDILAFEARQPAESPEQVDTLTDSVDALRALLDQAEHRWSALESRLEAQNSAISALREELSETGSAETPEIPDTPETSETAEASATPETAALREQIASLESYIAGRSDHWRRMEQDLELQARKIEELELELQQRIGREKLLSDSLEQERTRTARLKDRLRELEQKWHSANQQSQPPDLEMTQQIPRRHDLPPPIPELTGSAALPILICTSSDMQEHYVIRKPLISIGRGKECDIRILTDFVSRLHAVITHQDGQTRIEDQGSTNGVFVNNESIENTELGDGDDITIGKTHFLFRSGEA